ncbi:MAG TPA: hypothetical protein VGM89_13510 [Puia sp.]
MVRFIVPFLCASLLVAACGKSNSGSTSSGSLSATIGSASFQSTTTFGAYSAGINLLAVISNSEHPNDTSAIQIAMPWPPPINKAFPADTLLSLSYIAKGTEYDAYSTEGQLQLTVTSLDSLGHKIAGTFSATGHSLLSYNDSLVITNGKFSTSYNVNP